MDPSLTSSLAPQARLGMGLSALSVAFDALACGSDRGKDVLRGKDGGMAELILQTARDVAAGVAAEGRPELLDPKAQRCVLLAWLGLA